MTASMLRQREWTGRFMLYNIMIRSIFIAVTICLLTPLLTLAHHSKEYIQLEGYSTAKNGQRVFYTHYDYFVPDHNNQKLDHYEITLGMSYGITGRLMMDCHTHFAKFGPDHIVRPPHRNDPLGPSPFLEAAAFTLQYRITEPKQLPVDIAGSVLYEYAFPRSEKLLDGTSVVEATVIVSKDLWWKHSNICLNLNFGRDGDENIKSYGLGFKSPISEDANGTAAGIELFADFEGGFSVLPGIYIPLDDTITLKTGLGFGNEKSGEELRYHISLMMRF